MEKVRFPTPLRAGSQYRLVLKLAEDVESDVVTAGSIIVIRFKRPVDIPVDKLSDALISLQLFARDTTTGKLTKSMSAEIRGNTDELWLHGIRWLWKNRFNVEAVKK